MAGPFQREDHREALYVPVCGRPREGTRHRCSHTSCTTIRTETVTNLVCRCVLGSRRVPLSLHTIFISNFRLTVEATPGIEPGCADLQSAASPLRHVALRASMYHASFPRGNAGSGGLQFAIGLIPTLREMKQLAAPQGRTQGAYGSAQGRVTKHHASCCGCRSTPSVRPSPRSTRSSPTLILSPPEPCAHQHPRHQ